MNISPVSSNIYGQIASGNRLTSTAVSPSDLVISESMTTQANGANAGSENAKQGISALNIADGALGSITDNLQRIHELSIKASNGLLSDEDKSSIQGEISGLMSGIEDIAKNTQYNTKPLLNGGDSMHIATNPDGSGTDLNMPNSVLSSLGLDGYDVTKNFDINRVTSALDAVSKQRSQVGASTNALNYSYNQNQVAMENVLSSKSKISDLDIPKAVSDQKKNELLNTMQIMMQKRKQEEEEKKVSGLFV